MKFLSRDFTVKPTFQDIENFLPKDTDFGGVLPSARQEFGVTEFISSNAGHILLFAPAQINPSAKDGSRVSQKRTLHASKTSAYRLGAKLLSLVPKSLTSYGATNTQIRATSTQLAKRVGKEL